MLLAACVPDPSESDQVAPPPRLADDTCGANNYVPLIGQTAPVISVPANAAYRKYTTGDPVTMDYNSKRLNFEHDKSGKLVRVSCG
nr:I78 family peptidase inhibitor [Paracoccus aestuariivivens]